MYTEYINSLNSINKEQRNKFSISDDIINFLKTIKISEMNFNSLLQINKKDDDILYIIYYMLKNIINIIRRFIIKG